MRITKLVLNQYKRLMLSNIQHFEISPRRPMQLLIGSNGSGKSSLLEELTPLPAHHSGFVKGGYKEIHLQHGPSEYVLRSDYNHGTGTHSFVKDGQELNQGGTFAVQKDLVFQEFKLTREIHELLVGITPFSELSTAKRREWLTMLSPVDLGFAFDVHQRAKTAHRDQVGAIKHITKRLAQEHYDLPDDAHLAQMRQDIYQLTQRLDQLFQRRKANTRSPFGSDEAFYRAFEDALSITKRLLKTHPTIPASMQFTGSDDLKEQLQELKNQYRAQELVLERLAEEFQRLSQSTPSRDMELTDEQILELRQEVAKLRDQEEKTRAFLSTQTSRFPLVDLPLDRRPREMLRSTFEAWTGLMQEFPDNETARFTREQGHRAQDQYRRLEKERQELDHQSLTYAQRLARLKGCETVACPNCSHQFRPGVDPAEITLMETKLAHNGTRLDALEVELKELSQYLEDYQEFVGFVNRFRNLVQDTPLFRPVWDYCIEQQVMVRKPRAYLQDAVVWYELMEERIKLAELGQARELLEHRLRYVEAIDRDALTRTDQQRKELEREIADRTAAQRQLAQQIQEWSAVGRELSQYQADLTQARARLEQVLRDWGAHLEHLQQEALMADTKATQITLAQTQEKLSRLELRETLMRDIEKQHEELLTAQQELQLLVKAMSPTDGLIGRYLMGFMQVVVKFINAVIAEVWTYPMEVLPSKVEKDELDYNFPLNVNEGSVIAPDISRGSSSQRDIVNFAFKLLVMKFLKLENYPLYLDEFGNTFDEQHRFNLIPFINRLVELGQVNQIFYVSHFNTVHGAFNQAEVCVLDPTNITVPQVYNQHVVLK